MSNTTETTSTGTPRSASQGCGCGCGGHGEEGAAQGGAAQTAEGAQPAQPQDSGVVPGHKDGNSLGLRDVSATPAQTSGGCGCGSH